LDKAELNEAELDEIVLNEAELDEIVLYVKVQISIGNFKNKLREHIYEGVMRKYLN